MRVYAPLFGILIVGCNAGFGCDGAGRRSPPYEEGVVYYDSGLPPEPEDVRAYTSCEGEALEPSACEDDDGGACADADDDGCDEGYGRDRRGRCVWRGLVDDPSFELGCAYWTPVRQQHADDHFVLLQHDRQGSFKLGTSHPCSAAAITADAYIPATTDGLRQALVLSGSGSPGSVHVSFGEEPDLLNGTELFADRPHNTVVCLPESDRPYRTKLTISVGQTGPCDEEMPLDYEIEALEISPLCPAQ